MRYTLTIKQRVFLEKVVILYKKWPEVSFPYKQVGNILKNGCYYDDKSSRSIPPYPIGNSNLKSDKERLNEISSALKEYYDSVKTYINQ